MYESVGRAGVVAVVVMLAACSGPQETKDTGIDGGDSDLPEADGDLDGDLDGGDLDGGDGDSDSDLDTLDPGDSDALGDTDTDADADAGTDADVEELPRFRTCTGRDFERRFTGVWRHPLVAAMRTIGQPGHSITDLVITTPTGEVAVEGKFAYGLLSLDLEDEAVEGFIDDCTGWSSLGEGLTDSDGRAALSVPPEVLSEPGRYEVVMVVQGDGSLARGSLLVVPPATSFVVFDIDGTLTTSDSELVAEFFTDIFGGDHVPEPWPDARNAVARYAEAGYEIVYLTGRPYWLDDVTREWLADLDFPAGTLHLTRGLDEALSTNDGVGAYKRDYLLGLLDDHSIFRAYGNATTDIYGYEAAGLADESIYIIGEHAGEEGTQPIESYTDHLAEIEIPPAVQPFTR